jgi:hypothetical protein
MCCLAASMVFIGPRFAFLLVWLFDSGRVNAAFSTWLWPLLGIIFAPWTILMYVIVWGPLHGVSGFGWVLVGFGVFLDLATYSARSASKRYQAGRA